MKAIKGKDVLMEVYVSNEYIPFLCCEDMSININPELINKTTVSSGRFNQYRARRVDWDLSLNGISTILGSGRTIFETVKTENVFNTWPIRLTFADAQGNTAIFTGDVVLKAASITGPQSDFSDFENAFQGSGLYSLVIDDSNPESGIGLPGSGGGIGEMVIGSTFIIA
jgi:predicted secreted protein